MMRKICVITGTRAEYGLLQGILKALKNDSSFKLQLVVTGMHLSPEYGSTYKVIEEDGFTIDEKIEILLQSDSTVAITKSVGLGCIGFAEAFARLNPDIVLILGDRFEILAAAQAAMIARIPIAHVHGGELTAGVIDDAIRHSVTKMSQIHFVANERFKKRVIQLGENPDRVFVVGAPGIDNIANLNLLGKDELESELGITFAKYNFLVTYHPVTLSEEDPRVALGELFSALDIFPNSRLIITFPNVDTNSQLIVQELQRYADQHKDRVLLVKSLGQLKYLSLLQFVDAVIGNSSSGLIEAPSFSVPTINIGNRQKGRIMAKSVINCSEKSVEIIEAIKKAISEDFKNSIRHCKNPYGDGTAIPKIIKVLKSQNLTGILFKEFYDVEFDR